MAFYTRVLGAEELFRLTEPMGRIGHMELRIGPGTSGFSGTPSRRFQAKKCKGVTTPCSVPAPERRKKLQSSSRFAISAAVSTMCSGPAPASSSRVPKP